MPRLLPLLIALAACGSDDAPDVSDGIVPSHDGWQTAPVIAGLDTSCDDAGYFYALSVDGWSGGATLALRISEGEASWEELHSFDATPLDFDPEGAWDLRGLALATVDSADAVLPGVSSVRACEGFGGLQQVVVRVDVFDRDGAWAGCAVRPASEAPEDEGCAVIPR